MSEEGSACMVETNFRCREATSSPLALSRLTFSEIEQEIRRLPALIIPLGGCEPYGSLGSMGVASAVAEALAWELSRKIRLLCAPVISYGNSTAFMSFGGSAGTKPRTLTNTVCETMRMWYFQGIRYVIIIDALYENREAIDLALSRLARSNPECKAEAFSIQRDRRVREFVEKNASGSESYRSEYGMLSMAAWIDPGLVRAPAGARSKTAKIDAQRVLTWRKRGGDPEQLRKFAADGSCSEIAAVYSADFGETLFRFILGLLEEIVARIIRGQNP